MNTVEAAVRAALSEKRVLHVFSVAEETDRMCRIFGVSGSDAAFLHSAALLHDITKEVPLNEQIEYLAREGVSPTEDDLLAGETLHALSGAVKAKEAFGLPDPFCDAIRRHSTGGRVMTLFDKILFAADYIEENRSYESCRQQREYFKAEVARCASVDQAVEILDRVVYNIANETVIHLIRNDRFVHPNTLWMRNALSFKIK